MTHADLSFGVLGTELWSGSGLGLGRRMFRRLGRRGLLKFAGHALGTCRDWTAATFHSEQAHGLLAPWVLHARLGPDNAVSGFMTQVIACAVQLGGMPVPVGGDVRSSTPSRASSATPEASCARALRRSGSPSLRAARRESCSATET